MQRKGTTAWYTPATTAVDGMLEGGKVGAADHLAAIGKQYSANTNHRFDSEYETGWHFKVATLGGVANLQGKGTRYVLEVEFDEFDILAEHLSGHAECLFYEAPCVGALSVRASFDLSSILDLRTLMARDEGGTTGMLGNRHPTWLASVVLELGACDAYLQLCDEFRRYFDRSRLIVHLAEKGDAELLVA